MLQTTTPGNWPFRKLIACVCSNFERDRVELKIICIELAR